jgi:hypothetical protein
VADELEVIPPATPPATRDRTPSPVERSLDVLLSVQRPVVLAHIRSIRGRRADASPAQIVAILERRYLAAVTTGGALVGASAAIPAVGIGTSLVLSGVETAGFLEASALFAQSIAEIHGVAVTDPERARTLVMAMMLGNGGQELITQFAGQAAGGRSRTEFWGELVTKSVPRSVIGPLADQLQKTFIKKFAVTTGGSVVGRMIPFGIGAVVGGGGNHLLGRRVVTSSRTAFGPAPAAFPASLDDRVERAEKAPREPKAAKPVKEPKPPKAVRMAGTGRAVKLPRGRANYPMLPPAPRSED